MEDLGAAAVDRRDEQLRRTAVEVGLKAQELVRRLLDDDALLLRRRIGGVVELHHDFEVAVGRCLQQARDAVDVGPQVVGLAGGHGEHRRAAHHRRRRVAQRIDEGPLRRVQRGAVELVGLHQRGAGRAGEGLVAAVGGVVGGVDRTHAVVEGRVALEAVQRDRMVGGIAGSADVSGGVGRCLAISDLGAGDLVRRPGDARGRPGAWRRGDAGRGDHRRRAVRRGEVEPVDAGLIGGRARTAVTCLEADRRHGHRAGEGGRPRPDGAVGRVGERPQIARPTQAQVDRCAVGNAQHVAHNGRGSIGDRRREQHRVGTVEVHLQPEQVVGILLDDEALHLVGHADARVELGGHLEVVVRRGLQKPGKAVGAGPDVMLNAGAQADPRLTSGGPQRDAADGIDERPAVHIDRGPVELVALGRDRTSGGRQRTVGAVRAVVGRVLRAHPVVVGRGTGETGDDHAVARDESVAAHLGVAVGRRRPVGDLRRRGFVRRPCDRRVELPCAGPDPGDHRRRRVWQDLLEPVDLRRERRRRVAAVAAHRAHPVHRHGERERSGRRPRRTVAGIADQPAVAGADDPQVGGRAGLHARVVADDGGAVGDRGHEQVRSGAVVVDLRADQVVGVLLDDDALHLEAARRLRVELGLDLEVAVGNGLAQPCARVVVAPDIVGAAGRDRDARVAAADADARIPYGVDKGPDSGI